MQGGKYPYVYVDGIYLRRNWGGEYFALAKDTFKALSFTGILAHPTQRLSFRTGPNICYVDMFTLPQSTIVEVISMETGNDVIWVLCRFEYNGYMQYAYTGIKRFDISSDTLPWSDFQHSAAYAERDINVYSAPYGEGTLRGKVDMNEIVDVLGTMDDFAYIEFYDSSSGAPSRGWVICDDLSDLGSLPDLCWMLKMYIVQLVWKQKGSDLSRNMKLSDFQMKIAPMLKYYSMTQHLIIFPAATSRH